MAIIDLSVFDNHEYTQMILNGKDVKKSKNIVKSNNVVSFKYEGDINGSDSRHGFEITFTAKNGKSYVFDYYVNGPTEFGYPRMLIVCEGKEIPFSLKKTFRGEIRQTSSQQNNPDPK